MDMIKAIAVVVCHSVRVKVPTPSTGVATYTKMMRLNKLGLVRKVKSWKKVEAIMAGSFGGDRVLCFEVSAMSENR